MRGIAKAKVGQAGKKVRNLVMLALLLLRDLGLTIPPPVRYLALLDLPCPVDSRLDGTSVFPSINGRILNC